MHSKAIIISSLAAFALADTAGPKLSVDLPSCAMECIPEALKLIGCNDPADNVVCYCQGRSQIAHLVAPCLVQKCTPEWREKTHRIVEETCGRLGYPSKRDVQGCPGGNCPTSVEIAAAPVCTSGTCPSYAPAPVCTSGTCPSYAPQPAPIVCPSGGAPPCPTYVPAPPSNSSAPAPPAGIKPPVISGSSAMQAGLGMMGAVLLVAASVL